MFELILLAGFMAAAVSQLLPEEKNGSPASRKHSCRSRPQDKNQLQDVQEEVRRALTCENRGEVQPRPLPPKSRITRRFGAEHRGMQTAVAS